MTRAIGDLALEITSDKNDYPDTKVQIYGETLCWISYNDIDEFTRELNDVINKYRI